MPKSKKLEGFAVIVNGQLFRGPTQADVISQIKAASVEVDRR
jgi:hypothetical protein